MSFKTWKIIVVFCGLCSVVSCSKQDKSQRDQVCFDKHCINVEVVQKQEDLWRGLQFRKHLDKNNGMLFIFQESRPHSFWMKDTFLSLDMIWLDYARKVVHIERNVPSCKSDPCPTYSPQSDALYVLEVNAGYSQEIGIKKGQIAEFHLHI